MAPPSKFSAPILPHAHQVVGTKRKNRETRGEVRGWTGKDYDQACKKQADGIRLLRCQPFLDFGSFESGLFRAALAVDAPFCHLDCAFHHVTGVSSFDATPTFLLHNIVKPKFLGDLFLQTLGHYSAVSSHSVSSSFG